MASYDGSINIDARLNIKNAVINSKDLGKAIESLKSTVDTFGKDAAQSTNAYVNVLTKASTVLSDVSSAFSGIESGAQQMISSLSDTSLVNKSWKELKSEMTDLQVQLGQMKDAGLSEDDWQFAEVKERLEDVTRAVDVKVFSMATDSVKQDIATLMQQLELLGSAEGVDPYLFEELEQSIPPIIDQIRRLTNIYAGLSGKSQSIGQEMSDSMEEARQSTQSLESGLEDVENAESRAQTGTQEMAQSAEQSAQETSNAMNETSESANNASVSLSRAANSATRFARKIASGALKTAVNTIKSMGSAAVRAATNLAKMVGGNVLSFLRKLAEGAKNAAVQLAKMVTSAVANGVKKLGTLAGKATKSLLGLNKASRGDGFKEGLKFLVRYGFGVRSLFMLYRKLRGAVVEAFENMAKKVPEVNKSLSRLASSFDLLKNSLATAFQPILTAVTPYLVQLMDMMSEAAAKVGEFFAVLTGQNYIYKATKANIDYAKSLDKITKSTKKNTKETENQLASFDHLNILKENKDTGSSSDNDKNETPTADFKQVPIESAISDLARRIKDAFNKGDFTEIGEILADKLTEWVNKIDWAGLGQKIGNGINHVVDVVNGFFDKFDFIDLGQKIADGLNNLIETIDFYELGRAFTQKIRALIELAWGVVSRIDWVELGSSIGDFLKGAFNNIPWELLGKTLGTAITGVFTAIGKAIDKINWFNFGTRLANGFNQLFRSIKWTKIADTLNKLFKGVLVALKSFITTFEWEKHANELRKGIKKFIKDVPVDGPDGLGEVMKKLIIKVLGFITTALGDEATWKTAGKKFSGFLNSLFGTGDDESGGTTVWDALEKSVSSLLSGVLLALGEVFGDTEVMNNVGQKAGKFLNDILTDKELWSNLGTAVNKSLAGILTFGESFLKEFKPEDAATNIKNALGQIDWDGIATRTWNLAKLAFSKAGSFADALFSDSVRVDPEVIKNRSDPAYAKILNDEKAAVAAFNAQSLGTKVGAKISEALSKIPWTEIGKTMWENAKKLLANTGDFLSSLFNVTDADVKSAGGNKAIATGKKIGQLFADAISQIKWSEFGETFSTMVKGLFDAINGFFQAIGTEDVIKKDGRSISQLQDAIEQFFGSIDWGGIAKSILLSAYNAFKNLGSALLGAVIEGLSGDPITVEDMAATGDASFVGDFDSAGRLWADTASDATIAEYNVRKPDIEAAIVEANGVGRTDLLENKGKEATDSVVDGSVAQYGVKQPDVEAAIVKANGVGRKDLLDDKGKETADSVVDGEVNELDSKKEEVKKAYEGAFVKTYEDGVEGSDGFDIKSGKSSRTGKLGIANVKNMSEGMDSEKGTLKRSLKGIVDTSNSSWDDVKKGQGEKLDSMDSKLSTVMGSMTTTSEDETGNQAKPVYDNYGEIMVAVDECMRSARDYLIQYAGEMTDAMNDGMSDMYSSTDLNMRDLANVIRDVMYDISGMNWWSVGDAIIGGIADGIYSGWNWLNNTVWNLADSLFRSAKNALGIHSPSKVFREGIGENVGLGIAEGILDTKSEVMDSVASLADLASETMNETDLGDFVNADGTGLVDGLDSVLDVFSNKVQNSFSDMLSKLNAIANTVTFRTPAIATGTVLPYAVSGGQTGGSKAISDVVAKTNDEQTSALIQAFNNQTVAIVRAIEQYSTTNVNIDKKSLTDAIIEEINRRTRAAGSSPLLI